MCQSRTCCKQELYDYVTLPMLSKRSRYRLTLWTMKSQVVPRVTLIIFTPFVKRSERARRLSFESHIWRLVWSYYEANLILIFRALEKGCSPDRDTYMGLSYNICSDFQGLYKCSNKSGNKNIIWAYLYVTHILIFSNKRILSSLRPKHVVDLDCIRWKLWDQNIMGVGSATN